MCKKGDTACTDLDRYFDGGSPSHEGRDGRYAVAAACTVSDAGSMFFPAQFFDRGEGWLRGRLAADHDRFVCWIRKLLSYFAVRFDCGIGRSFGVDEPEKNTKGRRSTVCSVFIGRNGGRVMGMKKTVKGYMTVEASFLVAWTIFIFIFLIYLSFYAYDKCVLFQDAYAVCFRGSIQKDESQVVPYINSHIQEQFGKKYFGVGEVRGSVNVNGKTTSVTGECQVKVPFHYIFTLSGELGWNIKTEARAQIANPTKIIRSRRRITNIINEYGNEE